MPLSLVVLALLDLISHLAEYVQSINYSSRAEALEMYLGCRAPEIMSSRGRCMFPSRYKNFPKCLKKSLWGSHDSENDNDSNAVTTETSIKSSNSSPTVRQLSLIHLHTLHCSLLCVPERCVSLCVLILANSEWQHLHDIFLFIWYCSLSRLHHNISAVTNAFLGAWSALALNCIHHIPCHTSDVGITW